MKKKFMNALFMVIMTLSGFILLPLEVLLLALAVVYIPFEFIYHKATKLDELKKYSFLETIFHHKDIKKYKKEQKDEK